MPQDPYLARPAIEHKAESRAPGRAHLLNDWTDGCIAVTNEEIEEIWKVVPDGTPIEINP